MSWCGNWRRSPPWLTNMSCSTSPAGQSTSPAQPNTTQSFKNWQDRVIRCARCLSRSIHQPSSRVNGLVLSQYQNVYFDTNTKFSITILNTKTILETETILIQYSIPNGSQTDSPHGLIIFLNWQPKWLILPTGHFHLNVTPVTQLFFARGIMLAMLCSQNLRWECLF